MLSRPLSTNQKPHLGAFRGAKGTRRSDRCQKIAKRVKGKLKASRSDPRLQRSASTVPRSIDEKWPRAFACLRVPSRAGLALCVLVEKKVAAWEKSEAPRPRDVEPHNTPRRCARVHRVTGFFAEASNERTRANRPQMAAPVAVAALARVPTPSRPSAGPLRDVDGDKCGAPRRVGRARCALTRARLAPLSRRPNARAAAAARATESSDAPRDDGADGAPVDGAPLVPRFLDIAGDADAVRAGVDALSAKEIKDELKHFGVAFAGKKDQIVERLVECYSLTVRALHPDPPTPSTQTLPVAFFIRRFFPSFIHSFIREPPAHSCSAPPPANPGRRGGRRRRDANADDE